VLKLLFLTSLTSTLILIQPVLAQPMHDPPDGADETAPNNKVVLENPLQANSLPVIVGQIIRGGLGIIGSVALAVFVYGGLLWLTAAGNIERVQKGKNTLLWAAIGLLVLFSAYPLVRYLIEILA
jgi:hypothetical protein